MKLSTRGLDRPTCLLVTFLTVLAVAGCARTPGVESGEDSSGSNAVYVSYNALYAAEEVDDIASLTRRSTVVIRGEVIGAEKPRRADATGTPTGTEEMVFRDFQVRVDAALAGQRKAPGEVLRVRVLGGRDGDLTVDMGDSVPRLTVGKKVVLFLTDKPIPECPTTDGFQYMVYADGFGSYALENGRAVRDAVSGKADVDILPVSDLEEAVRTETGRE